MPITIIFMVGFTDFALVGTCEHKNDMGTELYRNLMVYIYIYIYVVGSPKLDQGLMYAGLFNL